MYFESRSHHVPLEPFCYGCHTFIAPQEAFDAFLSNQNSTALDAWLRPLLFPFPGIQLPEKYVLCRKPRCSVCNKSPKAFTFHNDCIRMFYHRCQTLSTLWSHVACIRPWQRARAPICTPSHKNIKIEDFLDATSKLGIKYLHTLPTEIISIITLLCRDSLLLRILSVANMANRTSIQHTIPKIETKLVAIGHWKRGTRLQCSQRRKHSFTRLGIDANGISIIDRYTTHEPLAITGCQSYVVEKCEVLSSVSAIIKHNSLRLLLPPQHPGFRMWDTPNPPPLERCEFLSSPSQSGRFRTLELSELTGITFFCRFGRIHGIHGHTKSFPSARQEYERLLAEHHRDYVWIYLPVKGIQSIGLIGLSALVIKSNDIVFHIGEVTVVGTVESRCGIPSTVIWEEPFSREEVPGIGLFTIGNRTTIRSVVSRSELGSYQAIASLDDVQTVSVFYEDGGKYLRGMLFTYIHGGQHTAGQCRLWEGQEETIHRPKSLIHRTIDIENRPKIMVCCVTETPGPSEWIGWDRSEMVGKVKVWYNDRSVVRLEIALI